MRSTCRRCASACRRGIELIRCRPSNTWHAICVAKGLAMWIETEPGEWPMMRYLVCFELGNPYPEDPHVKAYLRKHGLEPKRMWTDRRAGVACEVLQFGECYLGRHVEEIDALRERGVVASAVDVALQQSIATAGVVAEVRRDELPDLAWRLAEQLLMRGAVRASDASTGLSVDEEVLKEELLRAIGLPTDRTD